MSCRNHWTPWRAGSRSCAAPSAAPWPPGEQDRVRELRAELRRAERSWDALVTPPDRPEEDRQGLASLLPAREQVHQALTLLGTPAAPKLIAAVHEAFFAGQLRTVAAGQPAPGRGTVLPGSAGRQAVLLVPRADLGPAVARPGPAVREHLAAGAAGSWGRSARAWIS